MGSDKGGDVTQWMNVGITAGTTFLAAILAVLVAIWLSNKERKAADRVRREERLYHLVRDVQAQLYATDVAGEDRGMSETLKLSSELELLAELIKGENPRAGEYLKSLSKWYYENRRRRDELRLEFAALGRPATDEERAPLVRLKRDHGNTYGWVQKLLIGLYAGSVNAEALEHHYKLVEEDRGRIASTRTGARIAGGAKTSRSSRWREFWSSSTAVWLVVGLAVLIQGNDLITMITGGRGRKDSHSRRKDSHLID